MTKKKAERLTGYEIRQLPARQGKVAFGAFERGELLLQAAGEIEWLALESLVHQAYQENARQALALSDWRCARCRHRRRLQIHHRRYRSHGGTHQVENLEPVCWDCHRLIHARERSQ